MAKKVYTIGNYLYIDDTVTQKRISGSKSAFEFVSSEGSSLFFTVLKNDQSLGTICIDEMIDKDDISFTLLGFQNFKDFNSGFSRASGSGAQKVTAITKDTGLLIVDNTTPTIITDMTASLNAGSYLVNFNAEFIHNNLDSVTSVAKTDLLALYNELMALPATQTGHIPTYGSETLLAGVYTQTGATNITGTLTLNANGNPNAVFVFRCAGAFTTGASAEIVLTGGALSSNVWFVSEGASSTGASTVFRGSIISNQAAVSTGAFTSIEGHMFTVTGAIGIGNASVFTESVGASQLTLGSLTAFSLFAGIGNLTNTGASNIALSVGTNSGTITGFNTATVGGSIIPGGSSPLSILHCAVYIDGIIINDSLRSITRSSSIENVECPIVLQTVATITLGQTIDIRAYSEIGIQHVGPRMSLTIMQILLQ
jgi:hypothetical protein